MKNVKFLNKTLAVAMALVMVFAMSTSAFAVTGIPGNNGQYLEGDAIPPDANNSDCASHLMTQPVAADSINVTLVVEAGDAISNFSLMSNTRFRKEIQVTLTNPTPKNFTVYDAVVKANTMTSTTGLSFGLSGSYVNSISHSGNTWTAGQLGFDGWVFRVNDKFPVQPTSDGVGYEGTSITQTQISNNDVIHWFYDFPSQLDPDTPSCAADFVRAKKVSSSANQLTIQMQGHITDIAPVSPYIMSIDNYNNLGAGVAVGLYSTSNLNTALATATTNSSGQVTFSGNFNIGDTYIVKSTSTYYYCPNPNWSWLVDEAYFRLTGAYSRIVI